MTRPSQRRKAIPGSRDVRYLVLADRAVPYLLARVRWPDVAQAISAANPDWVEDQGLFDLPYDPSAVVVSFPQAASIAGGWGVRLHAEPVQDVHSYIRRMPANWSDLSPSERRTWGIESVGRRPAVADPVGRLRSLQARLAGWSAAARPDAAVGGLVSTETDSGAEFHQPPGNDHPANATISTGSSAGERRSNARVRLVGRAHIRYGQTTFSAGLSDLSERGLQCVLPEAPPLVATGATLGGPFLLEAEADASRLCLDVAGRVSWHRSSGTGTHLGVAFEELGNGESEGLRLLLAAAGTGRGRR